MTRPSIADRPAALLLLWALLAGIFSSGASAQAPLLADSTASITVHSTGEPIDLFIDQSHQGTTPVTGRRIAPGTHILRYAAHTPDTWRDAARAETVTVAAGDSLVRVITPPVLRTISSEPFGASIYAGDSLLGVTPSMLYLGRDVRTLRFVKDGFEDRTMPVPPDSAAIHVMLSPGPGARTPNGEELLAGYSPRSNLPLYASATIAVLSGVTSAYAKIQADKYYDEYRATGNEAALAKVRSFDRVSGVSLVLTEVGLSVFTYLLLTR